MGTIEPLETDLRSLPRVGGTDAGDYYEVAPDVIVALPRAGYVQTPEGARASLLELHRIARSRSRRLVIVVLVDRVRSQDSAARRVWRQEIDGSLICGLVLTGSSLLGRAIASFFIGLTGPRLPTQMVGTLQEAVQWGTEQIARSGGPVAA